MRSKITQFTSFMHVPGPIVHNLLVHVIPKKKYSFLTKGKIPFVIFKNVSVQKSKVGSECHFMLTLNSNTLHIMSFLFSFLSSPLSSSSYVKI